MIERGEKFNIFYAINAGKKVVIKGRENEGWTAAGLDAKGALILKRSDGSSETRTIVSPTEVDNILPSVVPNEFVISLKE